MKIAVVIATFNRRRLLQYLLGQIKSLNVPPNVILATIVIVDGSTDGTFEMLEESFKETVVIRGDGNWWWTKCMNAGFKKAIELDQDFVLIMNDDVELNQNYLETLLEEYHGLPDGAILGSPSVSIEEPHWIESSGTYEFKKLSCKFKSYHSSRQRLDQIDYKGVYPSLTLSGRGTLIPVKLFKKIGFYDEKLVQYGSDDEFIFRANLYKVPVFMSWSPVVYVHANLTSVGTAHKDDRFLAFLKSFFSDHSVNSLKKVGYLYSIYSYKFLVPFYIPYFVLGALYSKYVKYKS